MKIHLYLAAAGTAVALLFFMLVGTEEPNQVEVLSGQAHPDPLATAFLARLDGDGTAGQPLSSEPDLVVREAVGVVKSLSHDTPECEQPPTGEVSGGAPPPPSNRHLFDDPKSIFHLDFYRNGNRDFAEEILKDWDALLRAIPGDPVLQQLCAFSAETELFGDYLDSSAHLQGISPQEAVEEAQRMKIQFQFFVNLDDYLQAFRSTGVEENVGAEFFFWVSEMSRNTVNERAASILADSGIVIAN